MNLDDAIKALTEALAKATPGPWHAETQVSQDEYCTPSFYIVNGPHTPQTQLSRYVGECDSLDDVEFCALAHRLLPVLLDGLREAQQALAEAERLAQLTTKARDHYDEERRESYQQMCGWKARAEQSEAQLATVTALEQHCVCASAELRHLYKTGRLSMHDLGLLSKSITELEEALTPQLDGGDR